MTDNKLAATLSRLYRLRASDVKFGLETEQAILSRLRNPERSWAAIHVAGTNGKGSVCAMLESVLRTAGFRTGLYTSPHLVLFNERIRVNGRSIADDELAGLISRVEESAARAGGRAATFFELATAMAFEYFRSSKVDIAIIETGMGGRLDATNVISPLVSVITGIGVEHTKWLGKDVRSIAREKCGIIKPGIPVVLGDLPSEALDVASETAQKQRAPLVKTRELLSVQLLKQSLDGLKLRIESKSTSYGTLTIPLPGAKTPENAAIAVAALETLASAASIDVEPDAIKKGLQKVFWPGRFQVISRHPPVIVDGAHNPEAASVLMRSLRVFFSKAPVGLIFGSASDKDVDGFFRNTADCVKRCWAVSIKSDRCLPASVIAEKASALGCPVSQADLKIAVEQAKAWALEAEGVVCIAGSLFLAGEALQLEFGKNLFPFTCPQAFHALN